MTLKEKIDKLKELATRTHYTCEDSWYSCPLSHDGCADDRYDKNVCNCGADIFNRGVEELYQEILKDL